MFSTATVNHIQKKRRESMNQLSGKNKEEQSRGTIFSRVKRDLLFVKVPLLVLIVYCVATELIFHTVCPTAIVFGNPCSGCGLTRAGFLVLTGQFSEAAKMHVMIYFWLFLALYGIFFRYVLGKRPPLMITMAIVVSIITTLYYIYRRQLGILPEVRYEGLVYWGRKLIERF